ncbi:hypothetical protein [Vibrio genomosp. F6]|uniref:Uncharacterized protein n=1 Tax=Vibrio genomosp. F6 str. FF-238 TaxID=1191298 RepID=A0A1E5CVU1_9VIBR|nr:hypothetical protein [Vibrio genomosp. F6]OEE74110.1 hypothetical protein A130_18405 [Vibrio genomosp. F6 str. FF-238]
MKRLILNITLLVFMVLGSISAIANDSTVKYAIAISHDDEQIAYGKNGSGETALILPLATKSLPRSSADSDRIPASELSRI